MFYSLVLLITALVLFCMLEAYTLVYFKILYAARVRQCPAGLAYVR